jgi:hypothetical protein
VALLNPSPRGVGIGMLPRVRRFLSREIDSIGTLELLILFAAEPTRRWTREVLVEHLRSAMPAITERIKSLQKLRLVAEKNDGWQYCATGPIDTVVRATMVAYRERRLSVIEAIYADRTVAYREFADAFRLRDAESEEGE